MDFVRLLPHIANSNSLVSTESWEGIDLDKLFICRRKLVSPVSTDNCEGMELVSLLLYRAKYCSPVRELIDGDIVPCKLLLFRSN